MRIDNKFVNKQQTQLRQALTGSDEFDAAINLCLRHHAMLHAAKVSLEELWSLEDFILDDLTEDQFRRIPTSEEHSIAWCIWHLARIEDTAMNLLIAGSEQCFLADGWDSRIGVPYRDAGNDMTMAELQNLSAAINLDVLREYRVAVGRRTQKIIANLKPADLKKKVNPEGLERVMAEGALKPVSSGIRDYWGKRNIAGLLLMPASRHNIVHLNEALRLKKKRN
jgi:hypothetical protein